MTHDGGKKKLNLLWVKLQKTVSDAFFWLLSLLLFFRLSSGLNLTSGWSRIINHRLTHVSFSSSDRGRFSLLRLHTSLPVCLSVCQSLSSTSVTSLTPQHVRALCIVFVSFVPPLLALAAKLLINSSTSSIFTAQRQRVRRRWRWSQEGWLLICLITN